MWRQNSAIRPEAFGADPSGVNDSAPALQAAFDAAAVFSRNGLPFAEVYLGPGTYILCGPVKIPSQIYFHGAGEATRLLPYRNDLGGPGGIDANPFACLWVNGTATKLADLAIDYYLIQASQNNVAIQVGNLVSKLPDAGAYPQACILDSVRIYGPGEGANPSAAGIGILLYGIHHNLRAGYVGGFGTQLKYAFNQQTPSQWFGTALQVTGCRFRGCNLTGSVGLDLTGLGQGSFTGCCVDANDTGLIDGGYGGSGSVFTGTHWENNLEELHLTGGGWWSFVGDSFGGKSPGTVHCPTVNLFGGTVLGSFSVGPSSKVNFINVFQQ